VTKAGCRHEPIVAARAPEQPEKLPAFRWVNTVLGNLKTAITGTFHSIRRPYVPRYLAEFQWRFNRRARLADMLDQLLAAALTTMPRPYAVIAQPYAAG